MKTIWKFVLETDCRLEMPEGCKILSVQEQNNQICIWALVDSESQKITRYFSVIPTGLELTKEPGKFIGTVQMYNQTLVFHVFEKDNQ